jgi:beta-glucosidase
VLASYHLLLGHGLAAQAIRAASPGARVGVVNLLAACEPASDSDADIRAAARYDGHANRWWLDPIHGRGFPPDMLEVYGVDLPEVPGDLAAIEAPLDWLGVNYYAPSLIADDPDGGPPYAKEVPIPGAPRNMLGWPIRADGLEQVLVRLSKDYGAQEVYVTENGSTWPDAAGPDGHFHDLERVRYLEEHLAACGRAVRRGVPLAGYFVWSLLDNFEWADGYDARFGLVHVDFATQQRTIKDSGHRYADMIQSHRDLAHGAA